PRLGLGSRARGDAGAGGRKARFPGLSRPPGLRLRRGDRESGVPDVSRALGPRRQRAICGGFRVGSAPPRRRVFEPIRLPAALSAAQRQRNVMKTCVRVVFCAKPAAGAYSGKVYALGVSFGAWQTFCAGPSCRSRTPAPSPRRRRGKKWIRRPGSRRSGRPRTTWGAGLADASALAGVKVMVIDDSNTIRRSAEIFLLQAGCTVILAEDGFDALAKITDHQPDLVFVDIMMPRLDGYQTCALIKKNNR